MQAALASKTLRRQWRRDTGAALHLRQWDDCVYLYDERSGQTHLLNPMAAALFDALATRPLTLDELVQIAIDATGGAQPEGGWTDAVERLLSTLDILGLVRPCRH